MSIEKSQAIVLKNQDLRETSSLATFYTRDFGKISGIMKGVRGSLNQTNNSLEIFSLSEIVFYRRKRGNLYTVSQCDLLNYYKNIREEYKRIIYATYFVDLLNAVTPFDQKNREVFDLTVETLKFLEETRDPQAIKNIYEIKTLILSGFKPRIDACIKCEKSISEQAGFSVRYGGLLCKSCSNDTGDVLDIYKGTLATMLHIENADLESVFRLNSTTKVRDQLNEILDNFIRYHIDKNIKSKFYADFLL
jgi:DNA repair protein RecO (recombination protein O)